MFLLECSLFLLASYQFGLHKGRSYCAPLTYQVFFCFVRESLTPTNSRQIATAGAKYPLGVSFAPFINPLMKSLIMNLFFDQVRKRFAT